MSLLAITREVSPSITNCEVSFQARDPIDVAKAIAQHQAYEECLAEASLEVVSLPAEPDLPDSVFVEDAAVVFDEIAVVPNMGAVSRRPEAQILAKTLKHYRRLTFLAEPATLDGGDVLRAGRRIFVGLSQRTNRAGFEQLRDWLTAYDYDVRPVEVKACLHLKSACSYLGNNTMLANRDWVEPGALSGFHLLDVPESEPAGANVLLINDLLIMPASFPRTRALLEERGYRVRAVDVSELQKAEAGVTCCSLIFDHMEDHAPQPRSS